jgi:maltose/moltooligosaccharide transporter
MGDFAKMPKTMVQLAFVQYFSWLALFAMWLTHGRRYSHVYGTTDTHSKLYNEGADWVGVLFAAYNGFAAILAFLLPPLARATSRKTVHAISLLPAAWADFNLLHQRPQPADLCRWWG